MPAIPRTRLAIPAALATIALVLALPPVASAAQTLSVTKAGAATGTLTSSPAGIECGAVCSAPFANGATVTLTGAPGPHALPAQWAGCAGVNAEDECLVTMSAAKAVTATFEFIQYRLTVSEGGNGQGTLTSSPAGIECGALCSGPFPYGANLTLTAVPAAGSAFNHWSGGGCAGAGICATTIKSTKTVRAVFVLSGQRTLTVTKAGTGQGTVTARSAGIACGAICSAQVPAGKRVSLTATAAAGSAFAGFSGACSGTAKTCQVTMSEARSVTATFTGAPPPAPPPPSCVVPKLKGKTLKRAKKALKHAHCALGRVRRPKAAKGKRLRVRSSSPPPGTTQPGGGKVGLRLATKPKRKH